MVSLNRVVFKCFLKQSNDGVQSSLRDPSVPAEVAPRVQNSVFSHTKHLQINNLHIFTIVFHFRHTRFLQDLLIHSFFLFHMSDHPLEKGLSLSLVHDFGYPKFEFFTNLPFQAQNTPLQNCIPSLGSFLVSSLQTLATHL